MQQPHYANSSSSVVLACHASLQRLPARHLKFDFIFQRFSCSFFFSLFFQQFLFRFVATFQANVDEERGRGKRRGVGASFDRGLATLPSRSESSSKLSATWRGKLKKKKGKKKMTNATCCSSFSYPLCPSIFPLLLSLLIHLLLHALYLHTIPSTPPISYFYLPFFCFPFFIFIFFFSFYFIFYWAIEQQIRLICL